MADLQEKQFQLGDVVFGWGCSVEIMDWTPGSAPTRTQDVDNPTGDGVRMGKDFKGSTSWAFGLYTNGETEDEAWAALSDLAAAWDADDVRTDPGAVMPLRFRVAGQNRRVYGRPRRWTASPTNLSLGGRIDIEADFATVDHLVYDDEMKTQIVTIAPPLELDAGLEVPFIPPFVTSAGASRRETSIEIGGSVPTPIILTFTGPVEGAQVQIGDWTAALIDPVQHDNPVTIDARPWVRAATLQNGGGVRVSPRVTRISKMWLPPGHHNVVFTGVDPTGTASVLVSWHDAYRTPR